MKSVIAAGLLAALAIAPIASAEAAVIYTFAGASQPGSAAPLPLNVRLELTSAESSFNLYAGPSMGADPVLLGDVDRFVSLSVGSDTATPGFLRGVVNLSLEFDTNGNVTGSFLRFLGDTYDGELRGGLGTNAAVGEVGVDGTPCILAAGNCRVLGEWTMTSTTPTPVPEPMSIALFGAGLAGLAVARRRKA
jgi:hypothetical protein